MKVFVTGAREEVSLGLRRAGYQVYALVRSAEKGLNLVNNEVNIVIGDLLNPSSFSEVLDKCSIIVHTAADYTNYSVVDHTAISAFIESSKKQKKLLLYTSGILVYPNSTQVSDETTPTDSNIPLPLSDRPKYEKLVLESQDVIGTVIRPAYVFGKKSKHFYPYFKQSLEGKVVVQGNPNIIWSEVHIDDLVAGYIKIIQAPTCVVAGQVFNFADDSRNTNLAIAKAFAKAAGFKGEVEVNEKGGFPHSQKTVIVDYRKATHLLGWSPSHLPLLDEVDLYFQTWKNLNRFNNLYVLFHTDDLALKLTHNVYNIW